MDKSRVVKLIGKIAKYYLIFNVSVFIAVFIFVVLAMTIESP